VSASSSRPLAFGGLCVKPVGPWPPGHWRGFTPTRGGAPTSVALEYRPQPLRYSFCTHVDRFAKGRRGGRARLQIDRPAEDWDSHELRQYGIWAAARAAGMLLIHASAVVGSRGALVFLGQSTAGKSTISRWLLRAFPLIHEETVMFDRDGPRGRPRVLGSRLFEPDRKPATPDRVPVAGLFILRKAPACALTPVPPARVLRLVVAGRVENIEADLAHEIRLASSVAEQVPCFLLDFNLKTREVRKVLAPFLEAPRTACQREGRRARERAP
jgi:hypothetical protein